MNYTTKTLDTLNFCRMELQQEKNKKLTKTINFDKIALLEKIINKLQ